MANATIFTIAADFRKGAFVHSSRWRPAWGHREIVERLANPVMAQRKDTAPISVTPVRARRLFRLINFLGQGSLTRLALLRKLRIEVRGFYRDLKTLSKAGIHVALHESRYSLQGDLDDALGRLPIPDPGLTLGEARQLSRGRSAVHRKIKALVESIEK